MRLSTRNQLSGTIIDVDLGSVMAIVKVRLDGGDQVVTSSVTKDAALDLDLKVGQPATVFIKSTEVTIGVE
ncbi:Molybdopterin-binding protein [Mycobacterium numidiamassiliense]|jgi:molybdate transport system regulatory protein|uniref:Molybdopterin-binding protein n=1 Tax=Mycobacterium numidiamassiliense TaxID=1841861 RepID=A0A2U3P679_9MYCO|nr:TOBE domain-containing protein [Mycobacterium numidiamassiliense]SPM39249.1 Molybdopterin-binding protein [Mycobacterium numidiamassiliense]